MKSILFISILLFPLWVSAQYAEPEEKNDTTRMTYLDELVVSANRIPEQRRSIAQQVFVVRPTTIRSLNAQTTADLLQNTGFVAMQRSQQGGGSPILRGFEASRVLLVVDGVRMNNAIYRAGHLQNALRVDNNNLDHAEVLFGPSSTVYGSDALGGVIHFYTRNPELAKDGARSNTFGESFLRLGSANAEKTFHADINLADDRMGSFTSFTFSNFGDLRMGNRENPRLGEPFGLRNQYVVRAEDNTGDLLVTNDDPLVQKFSGYKQWDILQKFLYRANDRISHTLNFQYSSSTDIPRYDRLTDPGSNGGLAFAEWYYGPEKRFLASYQLKVNDLGRWANGMSLTTSYQLVEESRITRRFNSNNKDRRLENMDVYGLNLDFNKEIKGHKIRYGFDGQYNVLRSTATRLNITNQAVSSVSTRYPDGNNAMGLYAIYVTHTKELANNLFLNDGIRLGFSSLSSTFVSKQFFNFPFNDIQQQNLFASGNLGLVYTPSFWKFSLMGSTGYRVPNFDDLAKIFDTVTGTATTPGTLIIPNPDLGPERTWNMDVGITRFFGSIARLEAIGYYTLFNNAIAVRPDSFNGQSTIDFNGFPANVVSSQNAGEAYLYGYAVSGRVDPVKGLALTGSYNFTYGRVRDENGDVPLDHVAPAFGRFGAVFTAKKFRGELFASFSVGKRLEDYSSSGEDNLQYAPPSGMPGWSTWNLRASYDLGEHLIVQAGIDNIFDLQYRTFASGINSPGRNIFGTLRVRF